jgi:hypothetical protein
MLYCLVDSNLYNEYIQGLSIYSRMDDSECVREYFKDVGTKSILYKTDSLPLPKTTPGYEYVSIPNNGGFGIILRF